MPVLPVPMIIALILFLLLLRAVVTRESHPSLLLLIAACAVQSAIIALVQYYGWQSLRVVQPITATLIPPIVWLAFSHAARAPLTPQQFIWHGCVPVIAIVCVVFAPFVLDALIPLAFAGYGIALLVALASGEDSLPHSRLESAGVAVLAWRIVALSLLASALCDLLIAYSLAQGGGGLQFIVGSIVSSLSLLSLGALSLTHAIETRRESEEPEIITAEEQARDQQVMARLETLMQHHRPYLDPDLTLTRLARKLTVPAKQLSAAINRTKGENVSRLINRHRVDHACSIIAEGKSITSAMLDSGFNTKSNFNREFLRIKNLSPTAWQAKHAGTLRNATAVPISVIQIIT